MLNKEPSFAFYQWLILLLLSAWGGFVRYLIQVKNNEAELGWLNGLGQIIVSGFTGLLGGFLSLEIGLSTYMTFSPPEYVARWAVFLYRIFGNGYLAVKMTEVPRGIRNHNPCNIDYNPANQWRGLLPHVPTIEKRFCRFISTEYGIRAIMVLLKTDYHQYGLHTIAQLIGRWAPENENNTIAYCQ